MNNLNEFIKKRCNANRRTEKAIITFLKEQSVIKKISMTISLMTFFVLIIAQSSFMLNLGLFGVLFFYFCVLLNLFLLIPRHLYLEHNINMDFDRIFLHKK